MPELPEVQTIVDQLDERLRGRKVESIEIRLPKIFIGDRYKAIGARITGVERRAKIILIRLDNDYTVAVHLKMTGQLIFGEHENKTSKINKTNKTSNNKEYIAETVSFAQGIASSGVSLPSKHTQVIFHLDKGTLFFNDMRKFGWIKVLQNADLRLQNEKIGPEPFSKEFTTEYLTKILNGWGRSVKLLLTDQGKIAGIGNIYANEALWYSGISPMKKGREVGRKEGRELYESIKKVLEMGIKYQGASDNTYVNALGQKGGMQNHFMVYRQTGKPCKRCGEKIVAMKIGGRGTFFCPKCQR